MTIAPECRDHSLRAVSVSTDIVPDDRDWTWVLDRPCVHHLWDVPGNEADLRTT